MSNRFSYLLLFQEMRRIIGSYLEYLFELVGVGLHGDSPGPPLLGVGLPEGPEVDHQDHVGPEVAEHLGDHAQGSLERP